MTFNKAASISEQSLSLEQLHRCNNNNNNNIYLKSNIQKSSIDLHCIVINVILKCQNG